MGTQGAPVGPKTMVRAVAAVGAIAVAVAVWGCEKKSEETGAKAPEAAPAAQTAPAETAAKPEAAPAEAKPAEAQPAEAKPAEAKPAEAQPAEAKPTETAAAEATPAGVVGKQPKEHLPPFDPAHPYHRYPDGKWDFRTWRGYNMYHSICHVCHGPNALGSSFAPALKDSLTTLTYEDFVATVMNGRVNITPGTTNVMPSFGENKTVVKYLDSLYAYLKARSDDALGTETPDWEGPKLDPVQ